MNGLLILLIVIAAPYIALNLRRLHSGRRWAFTFCQVAKEWEERDRAERLAARARERSIASTPLTAPKPR